GWALTYSTAIRPPAPGLFSMITGCAMLSDSFCPTRRAKRSLPPPAAKPTIKRIGLLGKFAAASPCALADCAAIATTAAPDPQHGALEPDHGHSSAVISRPQRFSQIAGSVKCTNATLHPRPRPRSPPNIAV